MKRLLLIGIIILGIIGATAMTGYFNKDTLRYNKYAPKDPLIDLTFEYPEKWNVFERRGSYGSFIQVQVVEPLAANDTTKELASSISITIYPHSKAQFNPLSAQGLTEDIRKKRLSLKGCALIQQSEIKVAGMIANDDQFAYEIFKVPLQANAKPIAVIERVICFQRKDNYYAISLNETKEHFEAYKKIFDRIIRSIRFHENPSSQRS